MHIKRGLAQIEKIRETHGLGSLLLLVCLLMQLIVYCAAGWPAYFQHIYAAGMIAEYLFIFLYSPRAGRLPPEGKLLFAYALWVCISRVLNGDVMMSTGASQLRIVLLCGSFLCFGFLLSRVQAERMLRLVSLLLLAFFTVLGVAVVCAALSGCTVSLPFSILVGAKAEADLNFITVLSRHRNISSFWFALSLFFAAYLMSVYRKKSVRALLAADMLLLYVALSLHLSRASTLAAAVGLAMLAMLLVLEKPVIRKKKGNLALAFVVALLVLAVAYKGTEPVNALIARLAGAAPGELFEEVRDAENIKNVGGRIQLWRGCALAVLHEPIRLLQGGLDTVYMQLPILFYGDPAINAHNYLLDAFMLTGLPGLALLVGFTLLLLYRMIRVFFSEKAAMPAKALVVLLAVVLVKNMGEAFLLRADDISNFLFFLAAGVFLSCCREIFPAERQE